MGRRGLRFADGHAARERTRAIIRHRRNVTVAFTDFDDRSHPPHARARARARTRVSARLWRPKLYRRAVPAGRRLAVH